MKQKMEPSELEKKETKETLVKACALHYTHVFLQTVFISKPDQDIRRLFDTIQAIYNPEIITSPKIKILVKDLYKTFEKEAKFISKRYLKNKYALINEKMKGS